ncbi:MAG: minor capsid protein [Acidobacteria bacterium]|nr:minor capsid protein [Acidobacteriota bacterium]
MRPVLRTGAERLAGSVSWGEALERLGSWTPDTVTGAVGPDLNELWGRVERQQLLRFRESLRRFAGPSGAVNANLLNDVGRLNPFDRTRASLRATGYAERLPALYQSNLRNRLAQLESQGLGFTPDRLRRAIAQSQGVARNRARLIGFDQVETFNGELSLRRQAEVEITEFQIVTAGDDRVRPSHARVNGRIYSWQGPYPYIPGQPIGCRCGAAPVLDARRTAPLDQHIDFDPILNAESRVLNLVESTLPDVDDYWQRVVTLHIRNRRAVGDELFDDRIRDVARANRLDPQTFLGRVRGVLGELERTPGSLTPRDRLISDVLRALPDEIREDGAIQNVIQRFGSGLMDETVFRERIDSLSRFLTRSNAQVAARAAPARRRPRKKVTRLKRAHPNAQIVQLGGTSRPLRQAPPAPAARTIANAADERELVDWLDDVSPVRIVDDAQLARLGEDVDSFRERFHGVYARRPGTAFIWVNRRAARGQGIETLSHEVGHALDFAGASPIRITRRSFRNRDIADDLLAAGAYGTRRRELSAIVFERMFARRYLAGARLEAALSHQERYMADTLFGGYATTAERQLARELLEEMVTENRVSFEAWLNNPVTRRKIGLRATLHP